MNDLPESLTGQNLRELIETSGLSQQGMARALDLDPSTVRRYLADTAALPRAVYLAARYLADHKRLAAQLALISANKSAQ